MATNPFNTSKVRTAVQGVFAALIGSVTAWLVAKWGSFHSAWLVALTPGLSTVYYFIIGWLEKKFPKLLWFFGQLPKPVTPVPAPTPTPTPAALTYVETPSGNRWAADVNTMAKADEVTNSAQVTKTAPQSKSKTKRAPGR